MYISSGPIEAGVYSAVKIPVTRAFASRMTAVLCLLAWVCACSSTAVRIQSATLMGKFDEPADRLIIAAVDNDSTSFVGRSGSTPRGYDTVTVYGPTSDARRVMHSLETDYGLREVSAWPIDSLHLHCAVLAPPAGTNREDLLAKLSRDPRIKLAQPLQTFATRTQNYNDPYVGLQRGFQELNVAEAHPWSRGDGVRIAIIDTGVDIAHKDLQGNIAAAANFVDGNTDQFRRDRHGTEMAGVIAAVANNREGIVGIAPESRILAYKACWQLSPDADAARCNSFTLAQALVAAFDAHAQAINLSIAGPDDPLLHSLIQEGMRRGIVFVAAATPGQSDAPSLFHQPGVIEVAGAEDRSTDSALFYAPSHEILTLIPGNHYDFASGDSIATAEITGVVSLLLAKNHGLSATALHDVLRESGAQFRENGRVDACVAVTTVMGSGTCQPPADAEHRLAVEQTRHAPN